MSEFSDRPFVAGSLIGLRAFGIDSLGRLRGPSFPQVFKPGENEAECRKGQGPPMSLAGIYASIMGPGLTMPITPTFSVGGIPKRVGPPPTPSYGKGPCPCGCGMEVEFTDGGDARLSEKAVTPTEPPKPTHVLGGLKCSCGFYAYFDGRNDYKEPDRIAAVVEGYGVCSVGGRGFRAAKARLVAIVEPKAAVSPLLRGYLHRNYDGIPFYATKREALDAHPLTPPPLATPDDEDFWTREATS